MSAVLQEQAQPMPAVKAEAKAFNFYYGAFHALKNINLPVYEKKVTAMIGPSGCGKSTFLRSFNRMHDLYPGNRYQGEIRMYPDNVNILAPDIDPIEVRMRVSMVFQKPNPFPKSIYDNVAYGPRIHGMVKGKAALDELVEKSLRRAGLWDEVKDRLNAPGVGLSGGQQQRLVIARTVAVNPDVILMDIGMPLLDGLGATTKIREDEELRGIPIIAVTAFSTAGFRRAAYDVGFDGYLAKPIDFDQLHELIDRLLA